MLLQRGLGTGYPELPINAPGNAEGHDASDTPRLRRI